MPLLSEAAIACVAAGVIAATIIDLRTRRIPNVLTGSMAVAGIALAASGASGITWLASVAGLLAGAALMMPGHLLGGTGAGDVKLMGAVGAIVGPAAVFDAFLFSAIAGGVLATIVAIRRRRLGTTLVATGRLVTRTPGAGEAIRAAPTNRFAYGPAIAAGSLLAVLL